MCIKPATVPVAGFVPQLGPRKADFIVRERGSRRRRLWELEARSHCPVVGICLTLDDIRALVKRVSAQFGVSGDFELHAAVVQECADRNPLSELLHKELERRYALEVSQRKGVQDAAELGRLWRAALASGQVGGALWATLTHPACDVQLGATVYGDVHMLQHQLGAGERADLQQFKRLQQENLTLGRELADAQRRFTEYRDERSRELEALRRELQAVRTTATGHEAAAARYYDEMSRLREGNRELADRAALMRRSRIAEERAEAAAARLREVERSLDQAQQQISRLETTLSRVLDAPAQAEVEASQPVQLEGCRVLCVGGRNGSASLYRQLVERHGGEFVYHDGGLEESLGRLDASIAAADAVICQAGCISHNAYWRVKEFCKRTGKRCTFLRNPSLAAFIDGLGSLGQVVAPEATEGEAP